MWQLFLIVYFVFGASSFLLRRVLAQKFGEHIRVINAIFYFFFLLPTGIILSFFFPHDLNVGLVNLIFLFGGSIIWPISNLLALRANRQVDVGIYAIIISLSPLFTLAVAIPFLYENLGAGQYFGIGLLMLSGAIAAASQLHKHNRASFSGIIVCILGAAAIGLGTAYERFMLNRIDFGAYLIYGWGSQVFWAILFAGKRLKILQELFNKNSKTRQLFLSFGGTSVLRSVGFIMALNFSGSASIMSAATNFMSVLVIIAAYFFLKEREHMIYKWLAAGVGIIGLLLIAR